MGGGWSVPLGADRPETVSVSRPDARLARSVATDVTLTSLLCPRDAPACRTFSGENVPRCLPKDRRSRSISRRLLVAERPLTCPRTPERRRATTTWLRCKSITDRDGDDLGRESRRLSGGGLGPLVAGEPAVFSLVGAVEVMGLEPTTSTLRTTSRHSPDQARPANKSAFPVHFVVATSRNVSCALYRGRAANPRPVDGGGEQRILSS